MQITLKVCPFLLYIIGLCLWQRRPPPPGTNLNLPSPPLILKSPRHWPRWGLNPLLRLSLRLQEWCNGPANMIMSCIILWYDIRSDELYYFYWWCYVPIVWYNYYNWYTFIHVHIYSSLANNDDVQVALSGFQDADLRRFTSGVVQHSVERAICSDARDPEVTHTMLSFELSDCLSSLLTPPPLS